MLNTAAPVLICKLGKAYLKSADKALNRLAQKDAEALHHFRVSLRKFRSLIKAYGNELTIKIPNTDKKALRKLFARTGGYRDAEVQFHWLNQHCPSLEDSDNYARFIEQLSLSCAEAPNIYPRLKRIFPPLKKRLEAVLVANKKSGGQRTFAEACNKKLVTACDALSQRLGELVNSGNTFPSIHQTRIVAKKVRYLMEPIAGLNKSLKHSVTRLQNLQNILGGIHDLDLLRERLNIILRDSKTTWEIQSLAKTALISLEEDYKNQWTQLDELLCDKEVFELTHKLEKVLS